MENEAAAVQNGTTAAEVTSNGANGPRPAPERPAVRYMDDATFHRCLEKVVTVHDRLLAELAK